MELTSAAETRGARAPSALSHHLYSTSLSLERWLRRCGLEPRRVASVDEALGHDVSGRPPIVLVDVDADDVVNFVRQVRDRTATPIVAIGGTHDERAVAVLDAGADGLIPRAVGPGVVCATLRAMLRRINGPRRRLHHASLVVDLDARAARWTGADLGLTAREFDLLAHLVAFRGQVVSKHDLLENVWGVGYGVTNTATVTEHVRRVRRKLEAVGAPSDLVETVRGHGYRVGRSPPPG